MKRVIRCVGIVLGLFGYVAHMQARLQCNLHKKVDERRRQGKVSKRIPYFFREFLPNAGRLHRNLFSKETLAVAAGFLPLYLGSRGADDHVQEIFFDERTKTDRHQLPDACYSAAKFGTAVPIVGFVASAFFRTE